MFRTGAQLMILTLLVGLFLMRESTREPVATIDESFADFLAMNAKRSEQSAPVTLVQINEATLRQHPLPWTPLDYAVFFQSALGFRPESVATDEILAWDLKSMPQEQAEKTTQFGQMLREQVLQAPRVLLGARLGYPEDPDQLPELEPMPVIRKVRRLEWRVTLFLTALTAVVGGLWWLITSNFGAIWKGIISLLPRG